MESDINIDEYCKYFDRIYKMVRDTKARDFQYRQMVFCLFTNDLLYKWGITRMHSCLIIRITEVFGWPKPSLFSNCQVLLLLCHLRVNRIQIVKVKKSHGTLSSR